MEKESQVVSVIARSRFPRRKPQDFQLDATEAEVQIGQALDVQGNDLPLETAFRWLKITRHPAIQLQCGGAKSAQSLVPAITSENKTLLERSMLRRSAGSLNP